MVKKDHILIVKIGGGVIDEPDSLSIFLEQFANIRLPKILVHGGGKQATALSDQLGIKPTMIDGRRITDDASLEIVTMTYAGLINKKIVAELQSNQCNAVGFCGIDGNLLPATKRNDPNIDYGWVGDISSVNSHLLDTLILSGFVPVIAPLTHDGKGHILNTNADTVAAALATTLSLNHIVSLIYCFEKNGLLRDVSDPGSVIPKVSLNEIETLISTEIITEGMLPKVRNIQLCLKNGVKSVVLCSAGDLQHVLSIPKSKGTTFIL